VLRRSDEAGAELRAARLVRSQPDIMDRYNLRNSSQIMTAATAMTQAQE
jgi:hypothetical protein